MWQFDWNVYFDCVFFKLLMHNLPDIHRNLPFKKKSATTSEGTLFWDNPEPQIWAEEIPTCKDKSWSFLLPTQLNISFISFHLKSYIPFQSLHFPMCVTEFILLLTKISFYMKGQHTYFQLCYKGTRTLIFQICDFYVLNMKKNMFCPFYQYSLVGIIIFFADASS